MAKITMPSWFKSTASVVAFGGAVLGAGSAFAAYGVPEDYAYGLQTPVTEVATDIQWLHDTVLTPIIIVISLFVLGLLVYVMMRFSEKANPTPSRLTHHRGLEIVWTVVPAIILVLIAIPSFKLLYLQYDYPKPDVVIKAIGHQWHWEYAYPQAEGVEFESRMVEDADLKPGQPRLLTVDEEIVVPVNKVVHVLVTAADVIHNWTVPAFGSKIDAVPGRTTATWFRAEREGVYYGQCSELCGIRHAFMPITVRVVNDATYARWLEARKAEDDDALDAIMKEIHDSQKNSTLADLNN